MVRQRNLGQDPWYEYVKDAIIGPGNGLVPLPQLLLIQICVAIWFGNGRNKTKTASFIMSEFQHELGNPALFLAQW